MRNLLLFIVLLLASCDKPDTTCKDKLPDGYYVKYSPVRNLYTVCHAVCNTTYDYSMDYDNFSMKKDTIITNDTSWIRCEYHCYTFNPYHPLATFNDSCSAKAACIGALNTDGVTADFK